MTPVDLLDPQLAELAENMRSREEPFAIATVVRTAGATAAKPGAKAILSADGTILSGWIGGGCVRGAMARAALKAFAEKAPQLISLSPEEALSARGVAPGAVVDGVEFARNGCPSKGTIDIFIEPILPMPELLLYGESPVALALDRLAGGFHWTVRHAQAEAAVPPLPSGGRRMIVVATQGKGDLPSLEAALRTNAEHIAFVGSRMKFAALSARLREKGVSEDRIAGIQAPAGLPINAVTPEEIALSILAQLTQIRRARQTGDAVPAD